MEVRKGFVREVKVIINEKRGKRPSDFLKEPVEIKPNKNCPFCHGNEHLTPPEITRVEKNGTWVVRVVPNKFPIIENRHEVIIEGDHFKDLDEFEYRKDVFEVLAERCRFWHEQGFYPVLFRNFGKEAGASLMHPHWQLVAVEEAPKENQELMPKEWEGRIIFESKNFVVFAPFAPIFAFEVWIAPKKAKSWLWEVNAGELADTFAEALRRLKKAIGVFPYNVVVSQGKWLSARIMPRLNTWAGFELSTGVIVVPVKPEAYAQLLASLCE